MQMDAVGLASSWLEEINVVGIGANAEYGEFNGVTANYVVKSGSNSYRGSLDYRTTPSRWIADNMGSLSETIRKRLTKPHIYSRYDFGGQIGGPIAKDKLFFYGGAQQFHNKTQAVNTFTATTLSWPRTVEKINWAIAKSVKAEVVHSYNKKHQEGWGTSVALEAGSVTDAPTHFWSSRLTWTPTNKSLLEVRTGGMRFKQDVLPMSPNTTDGPSPRRDAITGISSVNSASWTDYLQRRTSFGVTLTQYVDDFAGQHALKFGTDMQDQSERTVSGIPGGMSFTDRSGVPDQVTIRADTSKKAVGKRRVFFAMDDWRVTNRLTLQPGLRFTAYRGSTPTSGTCVSTNVLEPRLGLAWDVGKEHKTVVRTQWGRYHQAIFLTAWDFMDTAGGATTITARVNANGTFTELNRVTPAQNSNIDPDFTFPIMDQYFVGVEHELFPEVSVKVQYHPPELREQLCLHRHGLHLRARADARSRTGQHRRQRRRWRSDDGVRAAEPGKELLHPDQPQGCGLEVRRAAGDRGETLLEQLAVHGLLHPVQIAGADEQHQPERDHRHKWDLGQPQHAYQRGRAQ